MTSFSSSQKLNLQTHPLQKKPNQPFQGLNPATQPRQNWIKVQSVLRRRKSVLPSLNLPPAAYPSKSVPANAPQNYTEFPLKEQKEEPIKSSMKITPCASQKTLTITFPVDCCVFGCFGALLPGLTHCFDPSRNSRRRRVRIIFIELGLGF